MGKFIDLTGQTFGRLTVLKRVEDRIESNGRKRTQWLCQCSCDKNNKVKVTTNLLKSEYTKSCGCLQKERSKESASKTFKKYNRYDLSGEYGIGYTSKDEEFYFDLEDYDKIKDYCWYIDNKGYVVARLNDKKHILLHKLLFSESNEVDHKKHNPNDNRKENLRVVTHGKNMFNKYLYKNNSSGVAGVTWHKKINKWQATITKNKKNIHLDYFDKLEDATRVRKEAEDKYFGEYSYDNSQK